MLVSFATTRLVSSYNIKYLSVIEHHSHKLWRSLSHKAYPTSSSSSLLLSGSHSHSPSLPPSTATSLPPPPTTTTTAASSRHELKTIFDLYRYAVTAFSKAGLQSVQSGSSSIEDASFLLLHELALPLTDPIDQWGKATLLASERDHLLSIIDQRVQQRMPLAYLLRGCLVQGDYFYIDHRVPLPSAPLAEVLCCHHRDLIQATTVGLVEVGDKSNNSSRVEESVWEEMDYEDYFGVVIDEAKATAPSSSSSLSLSSTTSSIPTTTSSSGSSGSDSILSKVKVNVDQHFHRVLELNTGCGCLAILAHRVFPQVYRIDAVDSSHDALTIATVNIEKRGLQDKIRLIQGDLFHSLSSQQDCLYDLILYNPTYTKLTQTDAQQQRPPLQDSEEEKDCLITLVKVVSEAKDYLTEGGVLLLDVGQWKEELLLVYPALLHHSAVRWFNSLNAPVMNDVVCIPKIALEDLLHHQ